MNILPLGATVEFSDGPYSDRSPIEPGTTGVIIGRTMRGLTEGRSGLQILYYSVRLACGRVVRCTEKQFGEVA